MVEETYACAGEIRKTGIETLAALVRENTAALFGFGIEQGTGPIH
jgi:hypothetical protein